MSSPLPLAGKVAIVTGSSRSIGASIATKLAADGASVVINYVSPSSASLAAHLVARIKSSGTGDAVAVQADLSTLEGGQRLLDEALRAFGKLDVLVLNAGIMGSRALQDVDEAFFDSHFNINVKGPLFLTKAAAPLLPPGTSPLPPSPCSHPALGTLIDSPRPGGRIVFFSSSLTSASTVQPNALVYVASKAAIEQFARVLAKDLAPRAITVNVVSPGPIDTALFREGKSEQQIQFIANLNPHRRLGDVDEVAPVVAFLASEGAKWVTGQNIRVNGGFVV